MASELDLDLAEVLEVSLRCSLCLERCRRPRSLYCLHTFCQDCLVQLVANCAQAGIIACPKCRLRFYVPPDGPLYFPEACAWRVLAETLERFRTAIKENKKGLVKVTSEEEKNQSLKSEPRLDFKLISAFRHMMLSAAIAVPGVVMPTPTSQGYTLPSASSHIRAAASMTSTAVTSQRERAATLANSSSFTETTLGETSHHSQSSLTSATQRTGESSTETVTSSGRETSVESPQLSTESSSETVIVISENLESPESLNSSLADVAVRTENLESPESLNSSLADVTVRTETAESTGLFAEHSSPASPEKPVGLPVKLVREFTLLYQPGNISCMPNGNIVLCVNGGKQAFVYRPDGTRVTQLQTPKGVTTTDVDYTADGLILVAETTNKTMMVFLQDGSYVKSVPMEYESDTGMFVHGDEVFFTSVGSDQVFQMNLRSPHQEIFVAKDEHMDIEKPAFLTANSTHVAFTTWGKHEVWMFDRSRNLKFTYSGQESGLAPLKYPCGIVIDDEGRLIVSDCENDCIHFVSSEGKFLGHIDLKKEGLYRPSGIALNSEGELVVGMFSPHAIFTFQYRDALKQSFQN